MKNVCVSFFFLFGRCVPLQTLNAGCLPPHVPILGQDGQACGHRPWCQGLAWSVARPTHTVRRVRLCAFPSHVREIRDRRGEAAVPRPMPAGLPTIPRRPQATREGRCPRWNVKAGKDSPFNLEPNAMACLSIILLLCFDLAREDECKTTLRPR